MMQNDKYRALPKRDHLNIVYKRIKVTGANLEVATGHLKVIKVNLGFYLKFLGEKYRVKLNVMNVPCLTQI